MAPTESERDEKETGRVEAFSDGVFAIAITLLVLELKVPQGLDARALRGALLDAWPSYFAFLTSFGTRWRSPGCGATSRPRRGCRR